jgi:hypothetical protein
VVGLMFPASPAQKNAPMGKKPWTHNSEKQLGRLGESRFRYSGNGDQA